MINHSLNWGLCAPASLPSLRRTRSLQVADIVARFHQLAVPGLGGVWFARQIVMALQGISIASELANGTRNIEAANAIEALSCWKGFKENPNGDRRLRGFRKIRTLPANRFIFNAARKRTFYVTIPMRMGTIEALPALGFVGPQRHFNAFQCTEVGEQLVRLEGPQRAALRRWIASPNTKAAGAILSSCAPLSPDARLLILNQLQHAGNEGDRRRRSAALLWVDRLHQSPKKQIRWANRPKEIAADHWHDMQAGAFFIATRDAAQVLLVSIEAEIARLNSERCLDLLSPLPKILLDSAARLNSYAKAFLDLEHYEEVANQFCLECVRAPAEMIRALVNRDGHILRLNENKVEPGNAFRLSLPSVGERSEEELAAAEESVPQTFWPENISYRIHNLYSLNMDLRGVMADVHNEGNSK